MSIVGDRALRRCAAGVAGAVLAAGGLAACAGGTGGGSQAAPAPTSVDPSLGKVTTGPDGVQQVTLQTQDDYVFAPNHFSVHPGKVALTVTNVGHELSHNFRFTPGGGPQQIGAQILLLTSGQKQTIDFTVTTPGSYRFECSFHADLGQVGTMTVGG
jgi:plastocyanin